MKQSESLSLYEKNLKLLCAERLAMGPILASVERSRRNRELAVARASAPTVNVYLRRAR